ncbi:hypothetical protein [Actinomadura chokoriensis]|jgi:hypothetical protein|uniref:hypothetical protein n=1 Tax=Actinomadura chokoriensis TaxID=454156 RepID=UPI0031F9D8AA
MNKLRIDDLVPEDTGVVELVGDDDLDLIVGAMAPGSGFMCSVTSGDGPGKPAEECFRV